MGLFDLPKFKVPKLKTSKNVLGSAKEKRNMQRQFSNKRIREPFTAKLKNAVRKRAKGKCEWPRCKQTKYLQFHHKNMRNDDNRVSNIILLCPNHHAEMHHKKKVVQKKDYLGNLVSHKVVSRQKRDKIRKQKKKQGLFGGFDLGI